MNYRKANLFCIGFEHSGTTSFYKYLNYHKDIFIPRIKEPNYFHNLITLDEYQALYKDRKEKYLGDFSCKYIEIKNIGTILYQYNFESTILIIIKERNRHLIREYTDVINNLRYLFLNRVYIINSDNFMLNPHSNYEELLNHLGLSVDTYPSFERYNVTGSLNYKLRKQVRKVLNSFRF